MLLQRIGPIRTAVCVSPEYPATEADRIRRGICRRYTLAPKIWLKPPEAMFVSPDETVQGQVDHIVNTNTALVAAGKEKFQADPFDIA